MKKKLLILSLLASFTLSPIVGKADFSLETHEESATLISAIDNQSSAMSSEQNSSVNLSLNATDSNLSSDSEVEAEFVAIQNLSDIENDSDDELFEFEKEDFQESEEEEITQDVEEFLEEKDGATETETVDNMVQEEEETQTLAIKEVNMQDLFDRSDDEDYLKELEEYFYSKLADDEKLRTYFYKNLKTDPQLRRYFSVDFDISELNLEELNIDERELRAYFYQMIKGDVDLSSYFYHRLGEPIDDSHTILYKKKKGGSSNKTSFKPNSKPAKAQSTTPKPVKQNPKSNNQGQKGKGNKGGKSGGTTSNKSGGTKSGSSSNKGNSSKSSGKGNNKSSSTNSSKGNSTKGSTTSNKGAAGSKSGHSQKGNNQPNKSKSGTSSLDKAKQGVKQANDKLVKHTQDNHKVINANNTYQATGYFYQPQTAKDKQIIAKNNQLKQGVAQAQQKVAQEVNKFHYTNVYGSIAKTGKRPDGTKATEVEKKIAPHIPKIDAGLKVAQTASVVASAVANHNFNKSTALKIPQKVTSSNKSVSSTTQNSKINQQGVANTGRAKNNLKPNLNAVGNHSVYKRNPTTGQITNYKTYEVNPKNPTGFQEVKGYDGIGKSHMNSVTGLKVPTPHVHDKTAPGKVREPMSWENPKNIRK